MRLHIRADHLYIRQLILVTPAFLDNFITSDEDSKHSSELFNIIKTHFYSGVRFTR